MADDLLTSDLALLAGPVLDFSQFDFYVLQVETPGGNVDVSDRIISLGRTKAQLVNWNPRIGAKITWPTLTWTVNNGDGYFSPNVAGNLWGTYAPTACSLVMRIDLVRPDTTRKVITNDTWPIMRVEQFRDRHTVNLIATTRAAALLAKEQSRDGMRHEVDFDTNSVKGMSWSAW